MSSLVRLTRPQKRRLQRVIQRHREARPVRRAQVVLQLAAGGSASHRFPKAYRSPVQRFIVGWCSSGRLAKRG